MQRMASQAAGGGQLFRGHGNFERAGHAHDLDLLFRGAGALECVERSGEQPISNELIEPADDDAESAGLPR